MTTDKNKPSRQNRLRKVLAGFEKHLPGLASITVGGVQYTMADATARIQKDIAATDAADKAHGDWRGSVQVQNDSHEQVDALLRGMKQYVLLQLGDTQDASGPLADFGYTPRKQRIKTVATKAGAVEKARATRVARHTMGSRQKAAITGQTAGPPTPNAEAATVPATGVAPTTPAPASPPAGSAAAPSNPRTTP